MSDMTNPSFDKDVDILEYCQPEGYGVIYAYTFDDGDIYVGQTTRTLKSRHKQHLKGRLHVDDKLRSHKYKLEILAVVPLTDINEEESRFIKELGTFQSDHGLNFTTGGNEFVMSEELRQKMSELKKQFLANNPEHMARWKESMRQYWNNPESHILASQKQKKNWDDEEKRKKQSETTKTFFKEHPERIEEMSKRSKERVSDPNVLSQMRQRSLDLWNDVEYVTKTLTAHRLYREAHPEIAAHHSKKMKEIWSDPHRKMKLSDEQKALWVEHNGISDLEREGITMKEWMSFLQKQRFSTETSREEMSMKIKQYYLDNPNARNFISQRLKDYYESHPEAKEQMSERTKKLWEDDAFRINQIDKRKILSQDPEYREKQSKARMEYLEKNPDFGASHSKKLKKYYENPENKKKASERNKMMYENHPEVRYARSRPIINADTGEVFRSAMDAARSCGADYANNIFKCLNGKRKTAFGYHWEYAKNAKSSESKK